MATMVSTIVILRRSFVSSHEECRPKCHSIVPSRMHAVQNVTYGDLLRDAHPQPSQPSARSQNHVETSRVKLDPLCILSEAGRKTVQRLRGTQKCLAKTLRIHLQRSRKAREFARANLKHWRHPVCSMHRACIIEKISYVLPGNPRGLVSDGHLVNATERDDLASDTNMLLVCRGPNLL